MNLFIDTNVFLSFYHYTSEDLEQLRKLKVLIENGDVTLCLPAQVRDEFRRNREKKIAEAIRLVKEQHLKLQFPQLCKDYEEYEELRRLQREYERHMLKCSGRLILTCERTVSAQTKSRRSYSR